VVHLRDSRSETGVAALAALRARLAPYEARGFVFHLVGGPVEFVVGGAELERNAARVVPLMVALVGVVLLVLFRSWLAAALALCSVGLAVLWTLGFQGWLGWPRNSLSQALPPLVLVIGVCDAIHLLAGYLSRIRPAADARDGREAALLAVVDDVGTPCLMTTLTTAAGFGSFAASGLESLARFGWVAAAGVAAALVLCFSLLPILVVRVPAARLGAARSPTRWERSIEGLLSLARRRPRGVVGAALLLGAVGAWGSTALRVDARFEDFYGEDSQVVRWVQSAARHLREAETLEIAVGVPPGERWDSAAALHVLAEVERLEEIEGLGRPLSILVPLREIHRLVHREALRLDGSEASGERARSMLRLLALEDPSLLPLFVDREGGALRVSFQAGKYPQEELRALLGEVRGRLEALLPAGWTFAVTGPLATVAAMIDEIRRTQLASFAWAGVLVVALIAAFFRSAGLAALALVPTGLPVLLTLGAMGLAGIALDVGSAMVAAVVLGLSVDNAIHVLAAWRRRRLAGGEPVAAIAAAIREVGRALATSALALALGFFTLALVPWRSIASFGLVSGVAILVALLAALLVLPALVIAAAGAPTRGSRRAPP
jgi:predicted RND superfamily exporter protein